MPGTPTEEEARIVGLHFNYLKDAVENGTAVFVGRTTADSPIGLAVFEAESDRAAREFMLSDPAVADGIMTAELHPFHIALMRGRDDCREKETIDAGNTDNTHTG